MPRARRALAVTGLALLIAATGVTAASSPAAKPAARSGDARPVSESSAQMPLSAPASGALGHSVAVKSTLAAAAGTAGGTQIFTQAGHYGGSAGPVALFGNRAVVAFSRKLAILDLYYRRTIPSIASYLVMPGPIDSVVAVWTGNQYIAPGHVLVGVARHGVYIVNCADPENPQVVGRWADGRDHFTYVALRDGLAYVTAWSGSREFRTSSLIVLDVSRPSRPGLVAALALPGRYADAVRLDGDHAFVANGWSGMAVVDVSDPTAPRLSAQTGTGGYATTLALAGQHVFLVDGGVPRSPEAAAERENTRPIVTALDVSDPGRPVEVGFVASPGRPADLAVADGYLYVAEQPYADGAGAVEGGGLRPYDVSDPRSPREGDVLSAPDGAVLERFTEDPVAGAMATLGTAGLATISLDAPAAPEMRQHRPGTAVPGACDIARLGDRLYATWAGDVYELDVSNPKWIGSTAGDARLVELENPLATPGNACAMAVADDGLLLVGDGRRLLVYDANERGRLTELSVIGGDGWGDIQDVSVAGDQVFIAEVPSLEDPTHVGGGLRVLDLGDPEAPTERGLLLERKFLRLVASSDRFVVAADNEALWILDSAPPGPPVERATYRLPSRAGPHDLAIHAGHALVARGSCDESWDTIVGKGGLDLINLESAELVSHVNTGSAYAVSVAGDTAYVATQCGGSEQPVTAIDVSRPGAPRVVGRLDGQGGEVNLDVSDGLLLRIGEQSGRYGDEMLAYFVADAWQAFVPSAAKGLPTR